MSDLFRQGSVWSGGVYHIIALPGFAHRRSQLKYMVYHEDYKSDGINRWKA